MGGASSGSQLGRILTADSTPPALAIDDQFHRASQFDAAVVVTRSLSWGDPQPIGSTRSIVRVVGRGRSALRKGRNP